MATSEIQVRVDDDLRAKAVAIYEELGIDLPTAIRMFLKRSVIVNGIPFSMMLPKSEYKAERAVRAMQSLSDAARENGTAEMTLGEINAEITSTRSEREALRNGGWKIAEKRIAFVRTKEYNKRVRDDAGSGKEHESMAKTANLYARIEPDVKDQAEAILSALGIPVSNAINMFYKQIILQRGIPFEMKLPQNSVPDIRTMTDEQLNAELEKGFADLQAGKTRPAEAVFDELRKEF